jgi:hypothetical protein
MYSCDNTDRVSPETHFHVILLAGRFCGALPKLFCFFAPPFHLVTLGDLLVLVRAKMALQANSGVTIQLAIRSVSSDLSSTLFTVKKIYSHLCYLFLILNLIIGDNQSYTGKWRKWLISNILV